ncbi:hypothetical protein DZ860_06535 [Vibrio sinensis]|uniref:Uncharacterized protein n=1 Tax=Vibrio sinensis TaxID=2302434 RepID=A0A3A6QIZ7_9VIBR|nr:hypothetical protein [Vibrio sinensis]RJX72810.1 hypothetical protein DZ860_06535 [Vibrio sinensis]
MQVEQLIGWSEHESRTNELLSVWTTFFGKISFMNNIEITDEPLEINWLSYKFKIKKHIVLWENEFVYHIKISAIVFDKEVDAIDMFLDRHATLSVPRMENLGYGTLNLNLIGNQAFELYIKKILSEFLLDSDFFNA